MSGVWHRVGSLPPSEPLAVIRWRDTEVISNGAAVFTRDGGAWQRLGDHLPGVAALGSTERGALLAGGLFGIHRWQEESQTWEPIVGLLDVLALERDADRLLAATRSDGVFRSDDDGATWRPCSFGLADQRIEWMSVTPGGVAVSTPSGGFELASKDDRWRRSEGVTAAPPTEATTIPAAPASPLGTLHRGKNSIEWRRRDGRRFRSIDDGASWEFDGTIELAVPELPGLPADVRELLDGAFGAVAVVERRHPNGRWTALLRAPARSGPWAPVLSTTGTAPVVVAEHGGSLLIAIGDRILRDPLGAGSRPQEIGRLPDPQTVVLAIGTTGEELLVATSDGIWSSRDLGGSWEPTLSSPVPIVALLCGAPVIAVDADGVVLARGERKRKAA